MTQSDPDVPALGGLCPWSALWGCWLTHPRVPFLTSPAAPAQDPRAPPEHRPVSPAHRLRCPGSAWEDPAKSKPPTLPHVHMHLWCHQALSYCTSSSVGARRISGAFSFPASRVWGGFRWGGHSLLAQAPGIRSRSQAPSGFAGLPLGSPRLLLRTVLRRSQGCWELCTPRGTYPARVGCHSSHGTQAKMPR